MRTLPTLVPLVAGLLAGPARAQAQTDLLQAADAAASDHLGLSSGSASVDSGVAVVGAEKADPGGTNSGRVVVFERNGVEWDEAAVLVASDGAQGALFGRAVAVSGGVCVVGAPATASGGSDLGRAYVFRSSGGTWLAETSFLGSDTTQNDEYGWAVDLDGPYAAVGAPANDHGVGSAGSVYVFRRDAPGVWAQAAILHGAETVAQARFGAAVGVEGQRIVVGAPFDAVGSDLGGAAYVFEEVGGVWIQDGRLVPNDPKNGDEFGHAVAIHGERAIVGAYRNDDFGSNTGAAYVYRRDPAGWVQEQKLLPTALTQGDHFGFDVSIHGDLCLVGARFDNPMGSKSGSAYLFLRNGQAWVSLATLMPDDGGANDNFGTAVDLSASMAVITAPNWDSGLTNVGSAYSYLVDDGDCDDDLVEDALEIAAGDEPDCNGNGRPDGCDIDWGVTPDFDLDGQPDECQTLSADSNSIDTALGGAQTLWLDAGDEYAGNLYLLLGSFSGTSPGLPVEGYLLPLNYDVYTHLSATSANSGPFEDTLGFLDDAGRATARIVLPPGGAPALVGVSAHHAYGAFGFFTNDVVMVSNAMPLDLE